MPPGLWRWRPPHLRIGGQNANHLGNASGPTGLPKWQRIRLPCRRPRRRGIDPWVRKIPWREWQPTPVFVLGNPKGRGAWRALVHGVAEERDTAELLSTEARGPREGRGRRGPGLGVTSEALGEPHPAKAIMWLCPPSLPPPLPQAQLQAAEGRPQEEPLPGVRGRSRRSQRLQPRALTCSGLPGVPRATASPQSHGDRCHRSRVSAHRALFAVRLTASPQTGQLATS